MGMGAIKMARIGSVVVPNPTHQQHLTMEIAWVTTDTDGSCVIKL